MALFGAPISHEDHAHRACYAALHLVEELRRFAQELKRERGLTFATRIGLNSGEVVVGKIGDDLRMDYTAQGRVVGIAARLQTLADPGEVYVSDTTAALVAGFFELESLGEFRLKGVSQPMRVCSLEGVGRMRTRLDVSRARGLSRFVGRSDEMASLESALARGASSASWPRPAPGRVGYAPSSSSAAARAASRCTRDAGSLTAGCCRSCRSSSSSAACSASPSKTASARRGRRSPAR